MSNKPPLAVAFAAAKGLELHSFHFKDLKINELKLAKKLVQRKNIGNQSINKMNEFYAKINKPVSSQSNLKNYVIFLLWGGDAGRRWLKKIC